MTPEEVMRYATYGKYKHDQEQTEETVATEKKEEEVKAEETTDEKYERLQKEFTTHKAEVKRKDDLASFKNEMTDVSNSFEFLKEFPDLAKGVQSQAASLMAINNRLTIKDAMTQVVEERTNFMKAIEEKHQNKRHANTKTFASVNKVQTGVAGSPNINSEKPYTGQDVKSGKSRADVAEFLREMQGD